MTIESRYGMIVELLTKEIDDIVEESFTDSGYDCKERYRDEQLASYLNFLIKDLQSDNAWYKLEYRSDLRNSNCLFQKCALR